MRHTLKEFDKHYNPDTIQLIFGDHLINIDTAAKGSYKVLMAFMDYKFDFVSFDPAHRHLILTH